jgi:hypothetical protein
MQTKMHKISLKGFIFTIKISKRNIFLGLTFLKGIFLFIIDVMYIVLLTNQNLTGRKKKRAFCGVIFGKPFFFVSDKYFDKCHHQ